MSSFEIVITRTAGSTLTLTEADSFGRVIQDSRELQWAESTPAQLSFVLSNKQTGTSNFLDTTFNLWTSGAGALALGQRVDYSVYPTLTGTKTLVFAGFIVDMQQGTDGRLSVTCMDDLYKMADVKINKTIFNRFVDCERCYRVWDTTYNMYRITGSALGTVVLPPVSVKSGDNDIEYLGTHIASGATPNSNTGTELNGTTRKVAQALIGHDIIGWIRVHKYGGATNTADLKASIQADAGGYPSGTDLWSQTIYPGSGASWSTTVCFGSGLTKLDRSARYWLVFAPTGDTSTIDIQIGTDNTGNYAYASHIYYTGAAWNSVTSCVLADVYYVDDQDVSVSSVKVSGSYVYLPTVTERMADAGGCPNVTAELSYYYGTVDLQTVATQIIGATGLTPNAHADCDRTFGIYRTRGLSALECLQEISDVFENSGSWDGYQHQAAPRWASPTVTIAFRKRKKTSDSSSLTIAHNNDTSTDSERVIERIDLRKMVKLRPSGVRVVGKNCDGMPLVRSVDDRGLGAASFRAKTGVNLTYTDYDESLLTMGEVDKKAWAILKSFARDTWEGRVTLTGVYPEVRDYDYGNETYGSGNIITMTYSPLGISSATKFKVMGFRMGPNTTEVQLSNDDTLTQNRLTRGMGKAYKSESFLTPDDMQTELFIEVFDDNAEVVTANSYMQLKHGSTGWITSRQLCTLYYDTDMNMAVYHAEFEPNNGYTVSGTDTIDEISLWNAATGGSIDYTYYLGAYEEFDKWKTMRVIVEYKMPYILP